MRAENVAIVGMPGSGKSYAAREIVRADPRVVYVDPMSSAEGTGGTGNNDRWTHALRWPQSVEQVMRTRSRYAVSWGVGQMSPEEMREGIAKIVAVAEELRAPARGWVTIVVDEIGIVCPRNATLPEVDRALRVGRHAGIRMVLLSQRAVDLPPTWRALCEDFRIYRQSERVDLDRLDAIRRGLGDTAAGLKPREWMRWRDGQLSGPMGAV